MQQIKTIFIIVLLLLSQLAEAQKKKDKHKGGACCETTADKGTSDAKYFALGDMKKVPNTELINQDGENVKFYELIKDKVVALNFIFTTCKTICPPMGANFAHLKKLMGDKVKSSEVVMLTISIDPKTDTPERLKAWSDKFEAGPGWTLLTGKQKDVYELLKSLEVYTALKEEHAPIVLLGNESEGKWVRANGLADPKELAKTLNGFFDGHDHSEHSNTEETNHDENYFTNVELINQHGEKKKLYADLMKDKVVIINPFFSECTGVCPVMNKNLEKIQEHLGDKLGKEVHIISVTVDYETDQPNVLKTYAEGYNAQDGWHFITGEKENIELALKKLGKNVSNREAHDSVFLVGNMNTKLWKKVNGLASVSEIIEQIDSVINDSLD
jgi:protein SCO1/2